MGKNNLKRKGGHFEVCQIMGNIKEVPWSWMMGPGFHFIILSLYCYYFEIFHIKALKKKNLKHNFQYLKDYYVEKELYSRGKKITWRKIQSGYKNEHRTRYSLIR